MSLIIFLGLLSDVFIFSVVLTVIKKNQFFNLNYHTFSVLGSKKTSKIWFNYGFLIYIQLRIIFIFYFLDYFQILKQPLIHELTLIAFISMALISIISLKNFPKVHNFLGVLAFISSVIFTALVGIFLYPVEKMLGFCSMLVSLILTFGTILLIKKGGWFEVWIFFCILIWDIVVTINFL